MARTKANVKALVHARATKDDEADGPSKPRKKIKFKWGTNAIREIKKAQKGVELLVPRAAMVRVIRELAPTNARISPKALEALRAATEQILIEHMQRAYRYTMLANKQTLTAPHMRAAADDMIAEVNRASSR
jgi:histone H3/H4